MDVYISSNGTQKGPFPLEQIRQMQQRHEILATDYVWYQGLPAWVPIGQLQPDGSIGPPPLYQKASFAHGAAAAIGKVAGRISSVAGVEMVEGLHRKEFFSEALKKRTDDEIEELFTTGTKSTTPSLETINTSWPHPWLFFKAIVAAVLLYVGFHYGFSHFENPKLLPGLILVGSFAIPLATLIFFVEMNVPRNMSLYQVFKLVNAGGLVAIIITLFLDTLWTSEGRWGAAFATGLVEEAAKIGTVLIFMRNKRFRWTLNGLLMGAAVGTGFAAFESAGYALETLLKSMVYATETLANHGYAEMWKALVKVIAVSGGFDNVVNVISQRALLAPAGHVVWTALAAAALWKVKGDQPFSWSMLVDPRFLRVFLLVVVCHGLWDLNLFNNAAIAWAKYVLLGFVAWVVALGYIQDGLKQIRQAQQATPALVPAVSA
jgi:RsiW-degrading membrane proteinase PrsW (M82 family)